MILVTHGNLLNAGAEALVNMGTRDWCVVRPRIEAAFAEVFEVTVMLYVSAGEGA